MNMAPRFTSLMMLVAIWCIFTRPEVIALVPLRIATWIPIYLAWPGQRIVQRIEHEIAAWLGVGSSVFRLPAPNADQTADTHNPVMPQHAPSGFLGWLVAAVVACKRF